MRRFLLALALFTPACAEWNFFRSAPVEVWFQGDDDPARKVLATFEQVRWWLARTLGRTDLAPLWNVRIMVVRADKAAAPYRTPRLKRARDRYVGGLSARDPIPSEWIEDFARILIEDDTKAVPGAIENGLLAVLSTLETEGARITIGSPPAPARRNLDWARMHLLTVDPNYAGRVRVFFTNLQQGADYDVAYRNAFEKTGKEMEAEVSRYFAAGRFEAQQIGGKPLNPARDYRERTGDAVLAQVALADLLEGGAARAAYLAILNEHGARADALEGAGHYREAVQNASDSAPAWVQFAIEEKDREKAHAAFQKAMQLNPRWAEPHARWADREADPERKIAPLKKAVELEPRNTSYWIGLAEAQTGVKDYKAALESWRAAARSASDETKRVEIEQRRRDFEQRRFDLEAAERKRLEDEKQRELDKLRQEALARIREAEAHANAGAGPADPNRKVVEWWDGPKAGGAVSGLLERVDCLSGPARLVVRESGAKLVPLLVVEPSKVAITGAGELTLGCGRQSPARRVKVEYQPKPGPKHATVGEVLTIEFR